MRQIIFSIFIALISVSCLSQLSPEPVLHTEFDLFLANPTALSDISRNVMNGIYTVSIGTTSLKEEWGDTVVCKWVKQRFCLYSIKDAVYSENGGGFLGDSLHLCGIMRIVRSGEGAYTKIIVKKNEGADAIRNARDSNNIIIKFSTSDGRSIILKQIRKLNEPKFLVMAHRGGCRNSERIGISENSLEMMRYAEVLGANGIEIDVKRTKDDKLIIFHDDTFSPRTVQGAYLLGNITDFTYNQINAFGRLIYGEKIPTLEEALKTVIDDTNLKLVWLDIKDEKQVTIDATLLAQKRWLDYAKTKGRDITILFGIPSDTILAKYKKSDDANKYDVLCELDSKNVTELATCKAWAPRWTTSDRVEISNMQAKGLFVFRWTVDLKESIKNCIDNEKVDGVLSNYPSLVAGINFSLKR